MRTATTHVIHARRAAPAPQQQMPEWLDKLMNWLFSGLRDDAYIH